MKKSATSGIKSINIKSTKIIARRFSKDFKQAVFMVNDHLGKKLNDNQEILISEIMDCPLNFESFSKLLFCLGFSKTHHNGEDHVIADVWGILTNLSEYKFVKAQSLFNFLCYLQSLETAVEMPKEFI
jgi:hypothetical protein